MEERDKHYLRTLLKNNYSFDELIEKYIEDIEWANLVIKTKTNEIRKLKGDA